VTENLASALAAFQLELPRLEKGSEADAGTYRYKYADLADVSLAVLPLLAKHGLSFSAKPTLDDGGRFVLEYALRHVSGESDTGSYPLPSGSPQQIGSAITYARRYTLSAMTGIAPDVDDDGKAAAGAPPVQRVHEPHWDPAEQEMLRDAWLEEIAKAADTEAIATIGKNIQAGRKAGEISPATYDHLSKAGAKRKAELNGAPA
jgi:hypothetical protein